MYNPAMHKLVEDTINLLSELFKKHFDDFRGTYLIGLHVDGKPHEGEDIELVSIFDSEDKFKREIIWPIVGKVETELDVYIDLNPTTMEALKKNEELYDEVLRYGVFFDSTGQVYVK